MPLPSEYEEYSGEIFDPTLHLTEIEQANAVLANFVSAMAQNRVPAATLSDIETAVCTLGKYAGYSTEALQVEMFLGSKLAANYRTTSNVLQGFIQTINEEISERLEISAKQRHSKLAQRTTPSVSDDDLPF